MWLAMECVLATRHEPACTSRLSFWMLFLKMQLPGSKKLELDEKHMGKGPGEHQAGHLRHISLNLIHRVTLQHERSREQKTERAAYSAHRLTRGRNYRFSYKGAFSYFTIIQVYEAPL